MGVRSKKCFYLWRSHLSLPICQTLSIAFFKKKEERERQQREFSGAQEGNCNYGFFANVRGPSWFWSACSPRTPGSLVSSHASQAQCLTEERALAAASTRPASQRVPVGEPHARGWQHSLPSASESSRPHSLVVFFFPCLPSPWMLPL